MLRLKPHKARPSFQPWLTSTHPNLLRPARAFSWGLPAHTCKEGTRQAGSCRPGVILSPELHQKEGQGPREPQFAPAQESYAVSSF